MRGSEPTVGELFTVAITAVRVDFAAIYNVNIICFVEILEL
jgi:hypothetical protein